MTKIVRVKPEAVLEEDGEPLEWLETDGYIWILVEGTERTEYEDATLRLYRSVATGKEYEWFDSEVEGLD